MTPRQNRIDIIATLCCAGFVIGWTIGPIFIEYLTGYVDVWTQNALRYTAACLFWLPLLLGKLHAGKLPPKLWLYAIPVTLVNLVAQSTWAASFYFGKPGFLVLLAKTCILFVAGFSILLFPDERPLLKQPMFWGGLLLAFAGTFGIVAYQHADKAGGLFWGAFFALAHSFSFAVYAVLIKLLLKHVDPRTSFSVITLYTAPCLMILALLWGKPAVALEMGLRPWMYVVVSAVLSIALSHVFFYSAVQRIGANIPSVLLLLIPFTVLLASMILFGERLTGLQWLSGMILMTGIAVTMRAKIRANRMSRTRRPNHHQ